MNLHSYYVVPVYTSGIESRVVVSIFGGRTNKSKMIRQKELTFTSILFICFAITAADEEFKLFNRNLTLPCDGCDSQDCYSVINGNVTNTGSLITQSGDVFLPSNTWYVYGSVCCGSDLEQLLCYTVCSYFERCEACKLTLSTNLSSVNGTIRVTRGEEMTFNITFTHQDHNGFSFTVNETFSHPNFVCTSVRDTNDITRTLLVQYHCVAMELGTYHIESYVTFCNFLYHSPTTFTVIVENNTSGLDQSTSSSSSMTLTNQTVSSGNQPASTHQSTSSGVVLSSTVIPTIVISTNTLVLPTVTTDVIVTDSTKNQGEGSNTTDIVIGVICGFTGLICIAVFVIVALLLLKYFPRTRCKKRQQPATANEHPMDVTQYGGSSRAVSTVGNTTDSGSYIASSNASTPWARSASSISQSLVYPVQVMSEPTTQVPEDACTSHQYEDAV